MKKFLRRVWERLDVFLGMVVSAFIAISMVVMFVWLWVLPKDDFSVASCYGLKYLFFCCFACIFIFAYFAKYCCTKWLA